jgi:hypothetical protein
MKTEQQAPDILADSPRHETVQPDSDIASLQKRIAALEIENKRLETWLGLVSKGYSIAINQLSMNTRMP